jgi:hypothetical protein
VLARQSATGSERLTETVWSLTPWLVVDWTALELGPITLGARVEVGLAHQWLDARAVAFVGQARDEPRDYWSLDGRPSVTLAWLFSDDVSAVLSAGLTIHSTREIVSLPPPFNTGSPRIDHGWVAFAASFAMAYRMF